VSRPPAAAPSPARQGLAVPALAVAVAVAALAGVAVALSVGAPGPGPAPAPVVAAVAPAPPVPGATVAVADVRPVALRVPDAGVSVDLIDLGLDPAGALEVPVDPADAGWFRLGPAPGERGPAVIAGHVDSRAGPGVFYRLREMEPGDEVTVERADGQQVRFRVTGVLAVDKDEFPTDAVYGPTPLAELRLITCGGEFDRAEGSYVGNVIVSATRID
jgi:hypothetical protein